MIYLLSVSLGAVNAIPCEINHRTDLKMSKCSYCMGVQLSVQYRAFYKLKAFEQSKEYILKMFHFSSLFSRNSEILVFLFVFREKKPLGRGVIQKDHSVNKSYSSSIYIPLWPLIVMCKTNLINAAHFLKPVYEHCMGAWRRWCFWCCSCWW